MFNLWPVTAIPKTILGAVLRATVPVTATGGPSASTLATVPREAPQAAATGAPAVVRVGKASTVVRV